mmetsp:Transcript_124209/g.215331  ORF Transcript_124209/g.215331 Transcript_124209/m.215331 type:complete len:586 (-) Transcript_124209:221-1978(-)
MAPTETEKRTRPRYDIIPWWPVTLLLLVLALANKVGLLDCAKPTFANVQHVFGFHATTTYHPSTNTSQTKMRKVGDNVCIPIKAGLERQKSYTDIAGSVFGNRVIRTTMMMDSWLADVVDNDLAMRIGLVTMFSRHVAEAAMPFSNRFCPCFEKFWPRVEEWWRFVAALGKSVVVLWLWMRNYPEASPFSNSKDFCRQENWKTWWHTQAELGKFYNPFLMTCGLLLVDTLFWFFCRHVSACLFKCLESSDCLPQKMSHRTTSTQDDRVDPDEPNFVANNVYEDFRQSLPKCMLYALAQLGLLLYFILEVNGLSQTEEDGQDEIYSKMVDPDCPSRIKWLLAFLITRVVSQDDIGYKFDRGSILFWRSINDKFKQQYEGTWNVCIVVLARRACFTIFVTSIIYDAVGYSVVLAFVVYLVIDQTNPWAKLQVELIVRWWLDFLINNVFLHTIMVTVPIMLSVEPPLDFVKDVTALFFILKMDDLVEPVDLTREDAWKETQDRKRLCRWMYRRTEEDDRETSTGVEMLQKPLLEEACGFRSLPDADESDWKKKIEQRLLELESGRAKSNGKPDDGVERIMSHPEEDFT